jgi:Sulfotransferase family
VFGPWTGVFPAPHKINSNSNLIAIGMLGLTPYPPNPDSLHTGRLWKRIFFLLQTLYLDAGPIKPIFILGCGRSGTTILGKIISRHRQILYLNEPRYMWVKAYQQSDISSEQAAIREGRLDLDNSICSPHQSRIIQRMFSLALSLYGKKILVDKLPEHAFRIPFLLGVFPDARFIHVIRSGVDVARSIEQLILQSKWYGWNNYKWNELRRLASAFPWGKAAVQHCETNYQRGLLEWRLSLEYAFEHLAGLPPERYLVIRYERLLEDPLEICEDIQKFLAVDRDVEMERYATSALVPRSPTTDVRHLLAEDRNLVGNWLESLGYLVAQ